MKKLALLASLLLMFGLSASAQKMKVEDVVAKHLNSIGTNENRDKIKNQTILGTVSFALALDKNSVYNGKFVFAADMGKRLFGMAFNNEVYPLEKISYNEDKLKIAFIRAGSRSALGSYLSRYEGIIKQGLLGGAIFNKWALNNITVSKAKIELKGTKKIDGKECYVIGYSPKKGFGVEISLFFDAVSFQHIRTEYRSEIGAQLGPTPESSASQTETREVLIETFSDFKAEKDLTLPHKYKINYLVSGRNTKEYNYDFELNGFYFNQDLDANTFDIEAK
jgi:hypothetical protein